jgi:hypothetical protein
MTDNEDIPTRPPERGRSRTELDAMTEAMWQEITHLRAQVARLQKTLAKLVSANDSDSVLPPWLPFPPPRAAEDPDHRAETPLFTLAHFVRYYNETYVGRAGSRAIAIPDCWLDHPALVAEIATLTYTWRAAHLGTNANIKDAQHWHHQWRPGFAERLAAEWVHAQCLTDTHKPTGAEPRPDRFFAARRKSP